MTPKKFLSVHACHWFHFGNIQTSVTANANTGYSFTGWTPGSQVFNPGNTNPGVTFTLSSTDSITAHFTGSTFLPEVPEANPSVSVLPNMFSESASIELYIPAKSQVSMSLYSVDGKKIMTLQDNAGLSSGLHQFDLNLSGSSLNSGIYFLEMISGGFRQTVKLVYNP